MGSRISALSGALALSVNLLTLKKVFMAGRTQGG
jgi:hypothetical protein